MSYVYVYVLVYVIQLSSRTRMELFHPGPARKLESASSWFYYKEICYDAQSHESKKKKSYITAIM
jgi:hypothetical protein